MGALFGLLGLLLLFSFVGVILKVVFGLLGFTFKLVFGAVGVVLGIIGFIFGGLGLAFLLALIGGLICIPVSIFNRR